MKQIVRFKLILTLLVFSCTEACFAQSISRYVISPIGNFFSNSSGRLFFNAGELSVNTTVVSNHIFTEGFVQPFKDISTGDVEHIDAKNVYVFPNPSAGYVQISKIGTVEIVSLELYDSQSRKIAIAFSKISDLTYSLNIAFLDSGIYFLKINSLPDSAPLIIRLIKI